MGVRGSASGSRRFVSAGVWPRRWRSYAALAVMVVLLTQALAYLGAHDASRAASREDEDIARRAARIERMLSHQTMLRNQLASLRETAARLDDEAARDAHHADRAATRTAMPVEDRRGTRDERHPEDGVRAVERGTNPVPDTSGVDRRVPRRAAGSASADIVAEAARRYAESLGLDLALDVDADPLAENADWILKPEAFGREGASRLRGASFAENDGAYAAVVIVACNRVEYLRRTVRSVDAVRAAEHGAAAKFPLFIAQDGDHDGVKQLAASVSSRYHYVQHLEETPPKTRTRERWDDAAYYRISAHYRFALSKLFDGLGYPRVIVLEDDMELAPDFFSYFEALGKVMDADPSVYAVSSWNDNGQKPHAWDDRRVYRSDFFPGLGWMLHDRLWAELAPIWPDSFWDDWMRLRSTRSGRETLRPEVCRTFNFGEKGASKGLFFKTYLESIRVAENRVNWADEDLSYLGYDAYEAAVRESVAAATRVEYPHQVESRLRKSIPDDERAFAVEYSSLEDFKTKAKRFGIFPEWKDGVPRARVPRRGHVQDARGARHRALYAVADGPRRGILSKAASDAVIPIPEEERRPKPASR